MITGTVLLTAFGFWERSRHAREPLLPPALLRDKTIVLLCALTAAVQFALVSIMMLGAINVQSILGYSAVISGLTGLPLTIMLATLAPLAGRLSDRIGSKLILTVGFIIYAGGLTVLILVLSTRATPVTFTVPYLLTGLGMSCLFALLTTEALRRAPRHLTGALAEMLNTARQLGSSAGSAVVGGVLATLLASDMRAKAAAAADGLPATARPEFLGSFAHLAQTGLSRTKASDPPTPPRVHVHSGTRQRQARKNAYGVGKTNHRRDADDHCAADRRLGLSGRSRRCRDPGCRVAGTAGEARLQCQVPVLGSHLSFVTGGRGHTVLFLNGTSPHGSASRERPGRVSPRSFGHVTMTVPPVRIGPARWPGWQEHRRGLGSCAGEPGSLVGVRSLVPHPVGERR